MYKYVRSEHSFNARIAFHIIFHIDRFSQYVVLWPSFDFAVVLMKILFLEFGKLYTYMLLVILQNFSILPNKCYNFRHHSSDYSYVYFVEVVSKMTGTHHQRSTIFAYHIRRRYFREKHRAHRKSTTPTRHFPPKTAFDRLLMDRLRNRWSRNVV